LRCGELKTEKKKNICSSCTRANWHNCTYNLAPAQKEQILEEQGNRCAACREPFGGDIVVDHDDDSRIVLGFVHRNCNLLRRWLRPHLRAPDRLKKVVAYAIACENKIEKEMPTRLTRPEIGHRKYRSMAYREKFRQI
jgi:hypothetical protein